MNKAKVYLIPAPLGEYNFSQILPPDIKDIIGSIDYFVAENIRTTRRYFSALKIGKPIQELTFFELNKRTTDKDYEVMLNPLKEGKNIGIVSEAGCPGIADPGAEVVKRAHQLDIEVVPLVGPSSILLAMMASGFNGQSFAFNGYLPIKDNRAEKIKMYENLSSRLKQTQVFIETPYRNQQLLQDFIKYCSGKTKLCLAVDITLESQFIKTKTLNEWKKTKIDIHKKQAIFILHS